MLRKKYYFVILLLTLFASTAAISAAQPVVSPAAAPKPVVLAAHPVDVVIDGSIVKNGAIVNRGEVYVLVSLLGRLQGKSVVYNPELDRVIADSATAGPNANRTARPNTKPVLEVVMGEPQYRELVEGLGFVHNASVAVPQQLQSYSCIILNNANAVSPKIAERLKKYVSDGGGLVLLGSIPLFLEADRQSLGEGTRLPRDINLPGIADWFGCAEAFSIQYDSIFGRRWQGIDGVPAAIVTSLNRPLGTSLGNQTLIFRYNGNQDYTMLTTPDEFCEIIANWQSENTEVTERPIAAFVHPYGSGRIYWQSVADAPNYPKLRELFRAGVYRAITGTNLDLK